MNFKLLDHGFLRVVDRMGDDSAVVQAARVSYGAGTKTSQSDRGLIRYLMRHHHTTPFEMCEIKFHVKAPIFVARQWMRHRTASINEMSGRYSEMPQEFYVPGLDQMRQQSAANKQGRDAMMESPADSQAGLARADAASMAAYREVLESGLTRELARTILPLSVYTEWYWKVNLHNLLHFIQLRISPRAQYEIRVYAERMLEVLKDWVPVTAEAFEDYRLNGCHLSAGQLKLMRAMLGGEKITAENTAGFGLSRREWEELETILGAGILPAE